MNLLSDLSLKVMQCKNSCVHEHLSHCGPLRRSHAVSAAWELRYFWLVPTMSNCFAKGAHKRNMAADVENSKYKAWNTISGLHRPVPVEPQLSCERRKKMVRLKNRVSPCQKSHFPSTAELVYIKTRAVAVKAESAHFTFHYRGEALTVTQASESLAWLHQSLTPRGNLRSGSYVVEEKIEEGGKHYKFILGD